jgi:Doubled CXXCH motif (Paired_CXXCH_1)
MRTLKPLLAATLAMGFFAATARAGIVGSAHDFGSSGWSKNQICLPCHTPHGGSDATSNGPLWNHTMSDKKSYSYTTYDASGVGTTGSTDLDPNSLLCMSCHDGTVALDSFGGATGNTYIPAKSQVGDKTSLTGNHPVGSAGTYPTTDNINTTASYMVAPYILYGQKSATDSTPDPAKTQSIGKLKGLNGKYVVGCTTCHEPHNRKTQDHLLWVKNDGTFTTNDGRTVSGSGLCLSCHKK